MFLRFGVALLAGGLIGVERQSVGKPAGLRTHMLVSLGAALFLMTAMELSPPAEQFNAASRTIQGIVTGIGFLGAAEVLRLNGGLSQSPLQETGKPLPIVGLTSAAATWVTAALGAAAGGGLWQMALTGSLLTVIVLRLLWWVEIKVFGQENFHE
jgi:putative Mg2+ transporter-C (MgtC) family protein